MVGPRRSDPPLNHNRIKKTTGYNAGSFHDISKKRLDRYIDEFEFRFNSRNNPYFFKDAIRELVTCGNLEYKELVA